jgi:hypothetical protein
LKRKKRKLRGVRGGLVEPEVWPSLSRSHLFCSSVRWTIWCCTTSWWEISNEFAPGEFQRSPPHSSLYLFLVDKQNKKWWKQKVYRFEYRGLQMFINSRLMQRVWRLRFLFVIILFIFFFCHGKLGIRGNSKPCLREIKFKDSISIGPKLLAIIFSSSFS